MRLRDGRLQLVSRKVDELRWTPEGTQLVATALVWFSLSLPFAGVNLLLTRTFFAIRRAWVPTGLAFANLALNAALSFALYKPLGIAGPVIGTAVASIGMTFGQLWFLRRELGGIEIGSLFSAFLRIGVASALTAGVSYLVWSLLEAPLGVSFIAQLVEVGVALIAGGVVFVLTVLALRVAEARTIVDRIVTTVRGRNG